MADIAETKITVRVADWNTESESLRAIRDIVFVREQGVPRDIEWDNRDEDAIHFIAVDQMNTPIGTARLLPSGQLGRMAVLPEWRNKQIGSKILQFILTLPTVNRKCIHLHAQVNAIPFYQRAGFVMIGERFMEAGIEHQSMELRHEAE